MAAKTQYPRLDGLQTPLCRLVSARHLTELQTTDKQGKVKDKPSYYFAVALPKNSPEFANIWNEIYQHTFQSVRAIPAIAAIVQQGLGAANFSWKIEDGDSAAQSGREGRAGCWILHFSTVMPVRCARWVDETKQNVQIDPSELKGGAFVDVGFSTSFNGNTDKQAGIYLNPNCLRLIYGGPPIVDGPSIDQVMKNAPVGAAPPGAFVIPTGATHLPPPATSAPAPALAPSPAPTPVAVSAPAPVAAVAETDEQWNRRHTGQHSAGYRFNPGSNSWDVSAPLAPAAQAPVAQTVPPPPAVSSPTETDEQWNIRHTGHAAPGYRWNVETKQWGNAVAAPVAPATVIVPPAPSTPPPSPPTAYPSNVQPHPQFTHGG